MEVAASRARDILPNYLLHHRRHEEHSHSRLQEDCLTHHKQAEQAIQQDAVLAQMQIELFTALFSHHVYIYLRGSDHQSSLTLCYHGGGLCWWGQGPITCLKHCTQSNIIWHGLCLFYFTAVCMMVCLSNVYLSVCVNECFWAGANLLRYLWNPQVRRQLLPPQAHEFPVYHHHMQHQPIGGS